ncbi:MAG: M48 family metallopeptidase [Candidatus Aerophobetes bacterium]|nr:M48 family metallopeptidase [Candidatus Aerophobetes bacterium]
MKVEVKRSKRRKRTISARLDGDIMYVYAPVDTPEKELHKIIENFKKRFTRRNLKREINKEHNLREVFNRLNKKYFDGKIKIKSIEYVTVQQSKYGCCNYKKKTIRLSHYVAQMPDWVRDYVIIHEMAHILEPNHSKAFWDIVYRYKLAERARGFLIAKKMEDNQELDIE